MVSNIRIRESAVAGLFYPQKSSELNDLFARWFSDEFVAQSDRKIPNALILPHAGYVYSGEAASKGYASWQSAKERIKTVVIMGPAHRVGFNGITTIDYDAVDTPFGHIEIDAELRKDLTARFPQIAISNFAQQQEHSLEVHFPFLKYLLPQAKVLPLLNGHVDVEEVKQVLSYLWRQKGVYFVISSDLSHFHSYDQSQKIDRETAELINRSDWQDLNGERACGYKGIQGLLAMQLEQNLNIRQLELINSGDTAGDKSRVVGYGSWAIYGEGR